MLGIVQAMAPRASGAKRPAASEAGVSRLGEPPEPFAGLALPNVSEDRLRALELEALGTRPVADPGIEVRGGKARAPPPPPASSGGRTPAPAAQARNFAKDDDERALAGKVYKGRVSNVMDFGCFVLLEGVRGKAEGLVHVSLIQSQPLRSPHDAVRRGQPCFVKVLSASASKLSLSMRDADQDTGADLTPSADAAGGPTANPRRKSDVSGEAERKLLQAAAGRDDEPARPIKRLTSPEL